MNSGRVGQPRTQDPRPSYAIYDSGEATIEHRRVTYGILGIQQKMLKIVLPSHFIERLDHGLYLMAVSPHFPWLLENRPHMTCVGLNTKYFGGPSLIAQLEQLN